MNVYRPLAFTSKARVLFAGIVIGALTITCWQPHGTDSAASSETANIRGAFAPGLAFAGPSTPVSSTLPDIAERVVESVVNISTERSVERT